MSLPSKYQRFIQDYVGKVRRDVKLSRYSTMKVGGPADLFVEAKTPAELVESIRLAHKLGIKYFILAGGSNVVFPDRGWRGLVVRYTADKINVTPRCVSSKETYSGNNIISPLGEGRLRGERNIILPPHLTSPLAGEEITVVVEVGAMLGGMVRDLAKQGLGGFNFLANIPGSVGGAIVGNAGCYGREIKEVITEIEIYDVAADKIIKAKPKSLDFSYRHSKLKHHPELIVLSAVLKLETTDPKQAIKEIAAEKQSRLDKHPVAPSCGSWFKNPSRTLPAWHLIDAAGLRGYTVGKAKISTKHPNFIVNTGGATAKDLAKIIQQVKTKVKTKTGTLLEEEARLIN